MTTPTVQVHRWTRAAYDKMVEAGVFGPEDRIELIEGEIVHTMSPQSSQHAITVSRVQDVLRDVFGRGWYVRAQMPLALGDDSEPEPDIAVVPGSLGDYREAHPRTAVLVVEVADTSFDYDRERKKRLYARRRIPEYWIVNLNDGCLEVNREPAGDRYQTETVLRPGDTVSPSACAGAAIPVGELLP